MNMNYTEIYKKIYHALLQDGFEDDHNNYDIIQVTRSAASDITYHLWKFLLTCENYANNSTLKQVGDVVNSTISSIENTLRK